jgi:hypothetical protein
LIGLVIDVLNQALSSQEPEAPIDSQTFSPFDPEGPMRNPKRMRDVNDFDPTELLTENSFRWYRCRR